MLNKFVFAALFGALTLAGCGEREVILSGERLDLRPTEQPVDAEDVVRLNLPAVSSQSSWTHRNGGPSHYAFHPALSQNAQLAFSVNMGKGDSKREFLSSDPIIGDGRIYTMDTESSIRAFSLNGGLLWTTDAKSLVKARRGRSNDGSGGGLAFSGGQLAATTAAGEVLLLNASNGQIIWRHDAEAGFSAPPAFVGDRIIAVAGDNHALALTRNNGRIAWSQRSDDPGPAILGTGSPAISGNIAVLAFNRGEVMAVDINTGIPRWSHVLTGRRVGSARGSFNPISGDPVIVGQTVYVGSNSGRLAAINLATGERLWTVREGAIGPIWPAGNALFVLTDQTKLKRLNTSDGREVWSVDLPLYKNARRSRGAFGYYGPTLAGGLLYLGGTDGLMRAYNPADGSLVRTFDIRGGVASQAAVVNSRMYLLTENGQLAAFQ